ncbi:MAG: hypothetical protein P8Y69_15300 [Gammaproteobacteria bacterium]
MRMPELAVINFSAVPDQEARAAVQAVNREITEDFFPIWGAGYHCKLVAACQEPARGVMGALRVSAEAVVYVVERAHVVRALRHRSIIATEVAVGFVFTDLGDWTVTLSHAVLELIVDPRANSAESGAHPRHAEPDAWLLPACGNWDVLGRLNGALPACSTEEPSIAVGSRLCLSG